VTGGPRYGVVGGLALDNVITADGTVHVGRPGGNTLWASLGASLYASAGEVAIVARAGEDYPQPALVVLREAGIRLDGVRRIAGPHRLRIAYQHLADGRRLQPVPDPVLAGLPEAQRAAFVDTTIDPRPRREGDPQVTDIPPAWLEQVSGWHIPLVPVATLHDLVRRLARSPGLLIADCPNRHEIRDFIGDLTPIVQELDVFSPSTSDLDVIAPAADPVALCTELTELTGTPTVLKCGPDGVRVLRPGRPPEHVPSLARVVADPTGAGDAFCGAMLVKYVQTGDLSVAARDAARAAALAVAAARVEDFAAGVREAREVTAREYA
jgi:ribokinase